VTSITDLSTLQYRVAQRSDDIVHERTSHTYVARWCRPNTQTMLTGNNYLRDSHLKGPNIQPVGNMALPRLPTHQHIERPEYTASRQHGAATPSNTPTHTLFDLYFAHSTSSLFKPLTTTSQRRQRLGRAS